MTRSKKKLGVNIDHVATLRQARRGREPAVFLAAREAERGGADGITVHLREDRRHIQDADLREIRREIRVPLNLEMAFIPEMIKIALREKPEKICLVPERRQELTTEGGLDVLPKEKALRKTLPRFFDAGIQVSLFIAPDRRQILAAHRAGAAAIEIHTGSYAHAQGQARLRELKRIREGARLAASLGLKVHAGHGLDYQNTQALCLLPEIEEFNIGHSIISRAVFTGLFEAVRGMKAILQNTGRSGG